MSLDYELRLFESRPIAYRQSDAFLHLEISSAPALPRVGESLFFGDEVVGSRVYRVFDVEHRFYIPVNALDPAIDHAIPVGAAAPVVYAAALPGTPPNDKLPGIYD